MEPQSSEFITIGNYKMLPPNKGGLIGQGAFGKVYKGINPVTKEFVALKIIPKAKVQKSLYSEKLFQREVEVQKQIKGKNIVEFIDLFENKSDIILVTEFANDGDLDSKINHNRLNDLIGLGENTVKKYFQDFLCGYKVLIDHNVIHRDIKPGNLLVHNGVLKLADFGLAKHMDSDPSLAMTLGIGSPLYMAPEVLLKLPYTNLCDVWAFGVTMHEALFGECPWEAKSLYELEKKLLDLESKPYKFPGKPDSIFKSLLEGMLIFDPRDRMTWEQLFAHPINQSEVVDISKVMEENTHSLLAKIKVVNQQQNISSPEKQQSGGGGGSSRIVILSQSKAPTSNENLTSTLKTTGITILNQTKTSMGPMAINAKKTVVLLDDEHMSEDAFREVVKDQEAKRISRTNKRIILNYNKIAQYILYATSQCEAIFANNASDSEETNFFSSFRFLELQGIFYKTAAAILQNVADLQNKNTLNLEQWEKFLLSSEFTEAKNVAKKSFDIVNQFLRFYQGNLDSDQRSKLDKVLLSEDTRETPELQAFLVSYEKNFVFLCYSMLKGLGTKVKKEFLVVVEYVFNVLHWKQTLLSNKEYSVEIDKLLEIVQNDDVKQLHNRIKMRLDKRFQALTGK